jgi:hypothetical protein
VRRPPRRECGLGRGRAGRRSLLMGRFQHFCCEGLGKWRIARGLNSVVDRKSSLLAWVRASEICLLLKLHRSLPPTSRNEQAPIPSHPTFDSSTANMSRRYDARVRRTLPFTPPSTESQANATTNRRPSSRPRAGCTRSSTRSRPSRTPAPRSASSRATASCSPPSAR